jgi:potassium/hydrogen antiporter
MLGLTITVRTLRDRNAWLIGLILAVLLTLLIRPLCVGLLIWPVRSPAANASSSCGPG